MIQCQANTLANLRRCFERAEMLVQGLLERALFLQALAAFCASRNVILRGLEFAVSQLAVSMRRKELLYVSGAIHPIGYDRFPSNSQCRNAKLPQSGFVSS